MAGAHWMSPGAVSASWLLQCDSSWPSQAFPTHDAISLVTVNIFTPSTTSCFLLFSHLHLPKISHQRYVHSYYFCHPYFMSSLLVSLQLKFLGYLYYYFFCLIFFLYKVVVFCVRWLTVSGVIKAALPNLYPRISEPLLYSQPRWKVCAHISGRTAGKNTKCCGYSVANCYKYRTACKWSTHLK
jgi:hypothetical protein